MTRAEDAIAAALATHEVAHADEFDYCSGCGVEYDYASHVYHAAHQTKAVAAAIRDLSADDLAELIGGEVEFEQHELRHWMGPLRMIESTRVVGPWRPADGLNGAGAATGAPEAATDAQGPA